MAHLKRGSTDRGQIVLLVGFLLAVSFVALALILNAAIYAENLATRSDTALGGSPVDVREETRAGTVAIVESVNAHNNTEKAFVARNISAAHETFGAIAGRRAAVDGRLLSTTIESITNGSRIVQSDATRNLTNRTGGANWTMATGVTARSFVLNVTDNRTSLGPCSVSGTCFRLTANSTTGTDTWQMAVYNDSSEMVVEVEDVSGTVETCRQPEAAPAARIDLGEETIDGAACPALGDGLPGPPYDLEITNGDKAEGGYAAVLDDDTIASSYDPARYYGPSSTDSPRVTFAGYATTLRITQRTDKTVYNGTLRVAPGEWP